MTFACNSTDNFALYPSCLHVAVLHIPSATAFVSHTAPHPAADPLHPSSGTNSHLIVIFQRLWAIFACLAHASIHPGSSRHFTVADSGATDHVISDMSAFISYKTVRNLQVRMGNNSYPPVLCCGTAIISLSGQRILLQNVLHVPCLVVPLYSLWVHIKQRRCGFIGTSDVGILVYFPTFVLSVDMSKNCHLAFKSLGWLAPLNTLQYTQPRCEPSLYPSKVTSHLAAQALIIVNDSLKKGVRNDSVAPVRQVSQLALATFKTLVTIEPDDNAGTNEVTYASHWPKRPPSMATPPLKVSVPHLDMAIVSAQLGSLADVVASIWDRWANDTTPLTASIPTAIPTNPPAPVLLSSMSIVE
jgi:hypothetical protein